MKIKENDTIISTTNINVDILKGTIGVVLNVLEENEFFLVEFVDHKGNTIGDGMETVNIKQIAKNLNANYDDSKNK